MRARSLLLVLLLTGCTGGGSDPAARPTRSMSPSAAAPAKVGIVVAVDRGRHGVQLFRVGADRHALPGTLLIPPHAADAAVDIALSAGATPTTCVVWEDTQSDGYGGNSLRCYGWADAGGTTVGAAGAVSGVALRPDGAAIAWQQLLDESGDDEDVVTAPFDGRTTGARSTYPTHRSSGTGTVDTGCALDVTEVTWAGDRLLVECSGENDYPGGLQLEAEGLKGAASKVDDEQEPPYNYLTEVGTADASSGLALQGEYCEIRCDDGKEPEPRRAVRFSLSTGKVLEVISTPAKGRYLESVSGGPKGIAYVTNAGGNKPDWRVYVRLPGEKHGVLVTGLPTGVRGAVAQP